VARRAELRAEMVQWVRDAVALQRSGGLADRPLLGHALGPYGTEKGVEPAGSVVGFSPLG
jgi:hypothetical protein